MILLTNYLNYYLIIRSLIYEIYDSFSSISLFRYYISGLKILDVSYIKYIYVDSLK